MRSGVSGSLLKHPKLMMSLLRLDVPLILVEDVWLVTRGSCEVLSLGEAEGQGSQEVVCILRSDQT